MGDPGCLSYRDFAAAEDELREFLAARVWSPLEGPRALFDRAVVWLIGSQVLLPGITRLARMVAEVRREENDRLHATLYRATPQGLRTEMARLLEVPESRRVSELEPTNDQGDHSRNQCQDHFLMPRTPGRPLAAAFCGTASCVGFLTSCHPFWVLARLNG